jgi:protein-L-isoaspartate O-methyltransferase
VPHTVVSAPHMYGFALEHLKIEPGCSFLDVGSGCGLMTALVAYLTGPV